MKTFQPISNPAKGVSLNGHSKKKERENLFIRPQTLLFTVMENCISCKIDNTTITRFIARFTEQGVFLRLQSEKP